MSKQPVPGASVKVSCYVASSWHGVKAIEHTATSTAPDGAYFVDPSALKWCTQITGAAWAPGYVPNDLYLSQVADESKGIPEIIYVMKVTDVPRLQLQATWRNTPLFSVQPGSHTGPQAGQVALDNYTVAYRGFADALPIATSPELKAWVRERYCPRLRDTHAQLSAQQLAGLDPSRFSGHYPRPDSYEREVLPYCGG